jgi:hypothetical protein
MAEVSKKDIKFLKRSLVFLLGIAQVVIGSLILANTGGILAGFGLAFITNGIKGCFDSIFNPS